MIQFINKIKFLIITLILIPVFVFADNLKVEFLDKANPIDSKDIYTLLYAIIGAVVKIGAVVVVFFLVYSGFLFVSAQGSEDKISKAKDAFLWTVVGALVLLGAFALSEIVCNTANQLGADVSCNIPRP